MNAPEPHRKEVDISTFQDSDNAVDKCRLKSGFLIFVKATLVQWFSKRQTVDVKSLALSLS